MEVFNEFVSIVREVGPTINYAQLWKDASSCEVLYFSVAFVIIKFFLKPLSPKGQKTLKMLFTQYNLLMSIYSLGSFLAMGFAMYQTGILSNNCEKAFDNTIFKVTAQLFYLSKFLEYIDSFYLPLMDKPLTFLQFFHHLGAPIDMWLFYHYRNEGVWIFVLLNGFIHWIMYGYYWTRLVKLPFPMPKSLITSMQIIQFNVGFYLVWKYRSVQCYRQDGMRMLGWIFNYWYVGMVLLLFLNFYVQTYILKGSKPSKKE